MKIVGGRDYYDTALSFGHDPSTVYVRSNTELKDMSLQASELTANSLGIFPALFPGKIHKRQNMQIKRRSRHSWRSLSRRAREETIETSKYHYRFTYPTVIACGKRYDGVRVDVQKVLYYGTMSPDKTLFFWDAQLFVKWMEETQLFWNREVGDGPLEDYFQPKPLSIKLLQVVTDRRWTILIHDPAVNPNKWLVDQPMLRAVQFFKAVEPNKMFQEIDMWVGGVLPRPGKPTVEISDEVRAAKHGMDETSFRKPKQK